MKGFKKLALASAVATLPVSGFAMEALDDATLSGVTGQDGLTISLATQLTTNIRLHDVDGFAGALDSGAIVISGVGLSGDNAGATVDAPISLTIDAGATTAASTNAALNVVVTLGNATTDVVIDLGTISVANSTRTAASADTADWGIVAGSDSGQIMDMGSVTIGGGTTLNIQLGNEITQTHMIEMNTTIAGGISIANFAINDAGGAVTGGAIGSANTIITDAGAGADLTVNVGIDANATGLVIDLVQLGTAATGIDVQLVDQYLGAAANVVGDVELLGLNLNGTSVTITGH